MDNKTNPATTNGRLHWLLSIQLMLVLLVPLLVFHIQHQPLKQDNLRELTSIAQQKASQIESWLNERLGDAQLLQNNPLFINMAVQLNRDPHYAATEINETFSQLQRRMSYESLTVFDQKNRARLKLGNPPTTKLNRTSFHIN